VQIARRHKRRQTRFHSDDSVMDMRAASAQNDRRRWGSELDAGMTRDFPQGTVHEAGADLRAALSADHHLYSLWEKLTPLGRNEFICWVEDAKQAKARQRRIERTCAELQEGKKRPCCWAGCIHRDDKAPGPWQQAVLIEQQGRKGRS
jgi:uncharacterized protein YdeI (YjbR/CyaY-like superfamily)